MSVRIQAVDRALRILEVLAAAETPRTLSEISADVRLHISTTHRLLATLRARGFVEQDPGSGRYRLGVQAFRIGGSVLAEVDLGPRTRPALLDLAHRTGETANLVVRYGTEAVYIDHVIGSQVAKLFTRIGQRVPLHCTAVGKVLLAHLPREQLRELVSGIDLTRYTPRTITARGALMRELARIMTLGYAVDREEHEVGVACVAAPVRDAAGRAVAAVGISGPAGRVLARRHGFIRAVLAGAAAASRALGYGGDAFGHRRPAGPGPLTGAGRRPSATVPRPAPAASPRGSARGSAAGSR